jgi:hypothetical protein
VRAAGVLRDVTADRARPLAGRIRRVIQAVRRDGAAEVEVHDAGLDHGNTLPRVDLQNARHARQRDDDAADRGDRTAAEACACPAGDHRHAVPVRHAHGRCDLLRVLRKDHRLWQAALDRAVELVGDQLFRRREDVLTAERALQVADHFARHDGARAAALSCL